MKAKKTSHFFNGSLVFASINSVLLSLPMERHTFIRIFTKVYSNQLNRTNRTFNEEVIHILLYVIDFGLDFFRSLPLNTRPDVASDVNVPEIVHNLIARIRSN